MYRILAVENEEDTLHQLKERLPEKMPNTSVEGAETVAEGRRLIKQAIAEGKPYDAVILDFRLPEDESNDESGDEVLDESLCRLVREQMPSAIVGHITSHAEGRDKDCEQIKRHVREVHCHGLDDPDISAEAKQRLGFTIRKDPGFVGKLADELLRCIHGQRIRRQLHALFGLKSNSHSVLMGRSQRVAGGTDLDVGAELSGLCSEIAEYWHLLDKDKALQERIQELLVVREEKGKVYVSPFEVD